MPNYSFSITDATSAPSPGNHSFKFSSYFGSEKYSDENATLSLTALSYTKRFLDVVQLSSTSLAAISAAVNGLDGLGQSFA